MTSHWDRVGSTYEEEWRAPAKQALSAAELAFVTAALARSPGGRVLDVGVGTGRVSAALLAAPAVTALTGIDGSAAMVDHCRARFAASTTPAAFEVRDVGAAGPPGAGYGFVSAIRVLKYLPGWRDTVARLVGALEPGGVLAFSMPNRRSLNVASRAYAVPWYRTSAAELEALSRSLGVELLDLTAFTKLPHVAYNRVHGRRSAGLVLGTDRLLARLLGARTFGRELFVAVRVPA